MIQMPRRSVTRYFIPLIDVLLLLFCIFLLMPLAREKELDKERESAAFLADEVEMLRAELERRMAELKKFEDLRSVQADLENLKKELDRLRLEARKPLKDQLDFHVIKIDPFGKLFSFDAKTRDQMPLRSGEEVAAMIQDHKKAAKERRPYYFFLVPPRKDASFSEDDEENHRTWFNGVETNLPKKNK